jgi:hypothetical protein
MSRTSESSINNPDRTARYTAGVLATGTGSDEVCVIFLLHFLFFSGAE